MSPLLLVVKQAFTPLSEANVAHTSRLEESSVRIASLEAMLAVQNEKIVEVNRKCEFNQLVRTLFIPIFTLASRCAHSKRQIY